MSKNSRYSDWRVLCPFYKYTKGTVIHCLSGYSLELKSEKDVENWKKEQCERHAGTCPVRAKLTREARKK